MRKDYKIGIGFLKGDSDPYTTITAYSATGHSASFRTHRVKSDESPDWNSVFNAGCGDISISECGTVILAQIHSVVTRVTV